MSSSSWSELYEEHGAALVLYARQWLPSSADAEDAVQDAFIRLLRSPQQFGDRPVPVLYQAVKWACLDKARRETRRGKREVKYAEPLDKESAFECVLEKRERHQALESAMKSLPEEQREVVTLKIWGDLGFREIGEVLGISINTAASRYRYALKRLGQQLSAKEHLA